MKLYMSLIVVVLFASFQGVAVAAQEATPVAAEMAQEASPVPAGTYTAVDCSSLGVNEVVAPISECGYVSVPESRASGSAETIQLAVVHVKSSNTEPGTPVFVGTGGPGGYGLDLVTYPAAAFDFTQVFGSVLEDRDFVFFTQRGTEGAIPRIDCPSLTPFLATASNTDGTASISVDLPAGFHEQAPGQWGNASGLAIAMAVLPAGTDPTTTIVDNMSPLAPVDSTMVVDGDPIAGQPTKTASVDVQIQGVPVALDSWAFATDDATYFVMIIGQPPTGNQLRAQYPGLLSTIAITP